MADTVVGVATIGDPRDPKTWSGTARQVVQGLERLGVKVEALDVRTFGQVEQLFYYAWFHFRRLRLADLLSPRKQIHFLRSPARSDAALTRMVRQRRARALEKEAQQRGLYKVLHLVPYAVPTQKNRDHSLKHYLMLDSTFHLETLQQPDRHERRTPALEREILQTERDLFANVSHFFPLAEYVREDLICFYGIAPHRITVTRTGLGGIQPYYGTKDYRNGLILCTAKARFLEKGGPLLVEAFQIARQQNPKIELVIVGQEYYRQQYRNIPGLTVLGHVAWEELQALFQKAALYAMPALSEPWGLVYLEALAAKTPILGLRRNAFPEISQEGQYGFLVDEPTPAAVAEALLQAMSDPDRLQQMGEAGQAYCLANYSWEETTRRIASGTLRVVPNP